MLTWKWSTTSPNLTTPVKKKSPWFLSSLVNSIRQWGAKLHQLTQPEPVFWLKKPVWVLSQIKNNAIWSSLATKKALWKSLSSNLSEIHKKAFQWWMDIHRWNIVKWIWQSLSAAVTATALPFSVVLNDKVSGSKWALVWKVLWMPFEVLHNDLGNGLVWLWLDKQDASNYADALAMWVLFSIKWWKSKELAIREAKNKWKTIKPQKEQIKKWIKERNQLHPDKFPNTKTNFFAEFNNAMLDWNVARMNEIKAEATKVKASIVPKEIGIKKTPETKLSLNVEKNIIANKPPTNKPVLPTNKPVLPTNKPVLPTNKPTLPTNKPTLSKILTETKPVEVKPIKKVETKVKLKDEIISLQKQKKNLEQQVKTKPELRKQLSDVYKQLSALQQRLKVVPTRAKKTDVFTDTVPNKDYWTKIIKPVIWKKQPKFTKKRIKATKELVANIFNEFKLKKEAKINAEQNILKKEASKIELSKKLTQENRMNEIIDSAGTFTEKQLIDNIYSDNILTDKSKLTLVDLVETKKTNNKNPITDKNPNNIIQFDPNINPIEWETAHINIVTKLLRKIKLNATKDFLIDNVEWFLKTVKFTDKNWNVSNLYQKINWVSWKEFPRIQRITELLWFNKLKALVEKNTKSINEWYDYVQKNFKHTIDWTSVEGKMRIWGIEDAIKNTDLYHKTQWVQWLNFSKFSVITNYVFWSIKARIEHFKQTELERITQGKNYNEKALKELKDTIEISPKDIEAIKNEEIGKAPTSVQKLLNETYTKYSQFEANSTMRKWNQVLWQEMVDAGLLPEHLFVDDYTHGYITYDMLQRYADVVKWWDIKALAKEMWFDIKDIETLQGSDIIPKDISTILKSKADVWFLHSQDPLSIMWSYGSEIAKLAWREEKLSILNQVKKDNKEVGKYLDQYLPASDNYRLKRILDIWTSWWYARATRPIATALSYSLYVANPSLILQNAAFATLKWTTKIVSDLALNEWHYWTHKLITENNIINNYLFNKWLLSHKITDVNSTLKWNVWILQKTLWIAKKLSFNEALKQSTSFSVWQWQSIVAWAYMHKVIKDNWYKLVKWETLVDTFKRVLANSTDKEKAQIDANLKEATDYIENTWKGSEASNKWLTSPLEWMIKMFSRWQISKLAFNLTDIIDAVHQKYKNSNIKIGKDVSRNTIHLVSNMVLYMTAYQAFAALMYNTEEERKKFVKYMYWDSIKSILTWYAGNRIWFPAYNIILKDIQTITAWWVKMINTDWSLTPIAIDMIFKLAVWIDKLRTAIERVSGKKPKPKESSTWWYKYTDSKSTAWIFWEIMWINPMSAWYQQASNDIYKNISKLNGWFFNTISSIFTPLNDLKRKINAIVTTPANIKFRTQIENINRRIKAKQNDNITSEEFIINALNTEKWPLSEQNKKLLIQNFLKAFWTNYWELVNLQRVVKGITGQKSIWINMLEARTRTKWPVIANFNKVLEEARVKNPQLYRKFYWTLYNIKNKNTPTEAKQLLVDYAIGKDMWWKFLSSSISNSLKKLTKKLETANFSDKNLIINDYDKLKILNDNLALIPKEFRQSIQDSLASNINIWINYKNTKKIENAVKDFPQISDLYRKAAELRWAEFKTQKVEKPVKVSKINKENIKKKFTTTKWTTLWTLPISLKKKGKLINLINLKKAPLKNTWVKRISLQTLLK